MGIEYKIKFGVPPGYDPAPLEEKLPDRTDPATGRESYSWELQVDGFYFCDHLSNRGDAAMAFYRMMEVALSHDQSVEVSEA